MQFNYRLRIFDSPMFIDEKRIKQVEIIARVIKELKNSCGIVWAYCSFYTSLIEYSGRSKFNPPILENYI